MVHKSKRRKTRRSKSNWDWYLRALIVLAGVVLGSFLWIRLKDTTLSGSGADDFAAHLGRLAAERGVGSADIVADDPIQKIDGIFVRTWQISLANRAAMEAFEEDVLIAAVQMDGRLTDGPADGEGGRRMRLDFHDEAFELRLSVDQPQRRARSEPTVPTPPERSPTATPKPMPAPGARGRLAVLLDDAGQSQDLLTAAVELPAAIGVSILPFLPESAEVAGAMHRSGHEVWLHLPMEPEGSPSNDPGPGAVLVSMSSDDVRIAVHTALNSVPHVVGVNNHMGSKATADLRLMTWVMQELKARGMAFIDSRTTRHTVAEDAARAQGVPVGRRGVFLDNERTAAAVRRQLDEAVYRCRLDGHAIAIGHLAPVTIQVLQRELPGLSQRGADLVAPSELVK
jgi:polysaccharide deacetylase 2 family uncharacterized protein YibQ